MKRKTHTDFYVLENYLCDMGALWVRIV
jgi:hypothetical protein